MRKQLWMCAVLLLGLFVLQTGLALAEIDLATVQKILAEDGKSHDAFGWSISVSGDTAVVF